MNLLVQACNLTNAINLSKIGVHTVIVGEINFASRLPGDVTIEEIKQLKQKGIRFAVLVNNLFSETELESLELYLIELSKIKPESVIFHDFAVCYINEEKKLGLNLTYHPETVVTSYAQFDFYKKNNINSVCLARELFLSEVKKINSNAEGMRTEVQAHGLCFMMQSRWNMMESYKQYVENKDLSFSQRDLMLIKEETRDLGNYIFEDRNGTHMFTGYEMCTIDILDKLQNSLINNIRIDSAMREQEWIEEVSTVYIEAINHLNKDKEDYKNNANIYLERIQKINSKTVLSKGFYGPAMENLHLQKNFKGGK
jgi:U32 family peptidase